jgi:hypothetical protein
MISDRGTRKAERKNKSARVADAVMSTADFRKRTFQFGIRIIRLMQALPKTDASRVIGNQLLRARSRADFIAKMGFVEEECDESLYWLEMLAEIGLINADRSKELRVEGNEILAIVVASIRTARGNAKQTVRYTERG